jgi:hypothetical protein
MTKEEKEKLLDKIEDIVKPCKYCKYALLDQKEKPCCDCQEISTGSDYKFIHHDWELGPPPLPFTAAGDPQSTDEYLTMRIEHLESMLLELMSEIKLLRGRVQANEGDMHTLRFKREEDRRRETSRRRYPIYGL